MNADAVMVLNWRPSCVKFACYPEDWVASCHGYFPLYISRVTNWQPVPHFILWPSASAFASSARRPMAPVVHTEKSQHNWTDWKDFIGQHGRFTVCVSINVEIAKIKYTSIPQKKRTHCKIALVFAWGGVLVNSKKCMFRFNRNIFFAAAGHMIRGLM